MGGQNNPSVLEPETKYEFGAEAQGWNVVDFLEPPITVKNWAPYVEDYQSKGVQALWPADTANFVPFAQAMTTAGYHPAFVALGTQFANSQTQQAVAANPSLPPVYVETSWWPLSMASQNPSTEQLVNVMHTYAKGDTVDFDDEEGAEAWLLWAKSASACGANLTVTCVLNHAAAVTNWDAGGIEAPIASLTLSNENPQPSPCFALMKGGAKGFDLRQGDHPAHAVHLELQPQERRPPDLTTAAATERPCEHGFGQAAGTGANCIVLPRQATDHSVGGRPCMTSSSSPSAAWLQRASTR